MNKDASKKAMARTRARRMARLAGDQARTPVVAPTDQTVGAPPEIASEASLLPETTAEAPRPARPSPVLMLVVDEEEEVEFCAPDVGAHTATCDGAPAETQDLEPPFDPPDLEELLHTEDLDEDPNPAPCGDVLELGAADAVDEHGREEDALQNTALADDEEPPFDPIDVEELTPPSFSVPVAAPQRPAPTPANENARGAALGQVRNAVPEGAREMPAPAIRIYLSWDQPERADFFARVAADPRLSRTEVTIARGGLDGAAIHCMSHQRPDLLVIDTTLRGAAMLASLDRLLEAAGGETRIIVLGAVNDVSLLRDLAHRGVDEYMVWPVPPEDVAGSACAMFAGTDKARVIAVVGARGGIGASTIAQNLAWSIADRQRAHTTLVDLDLPFGVAAFNCRVEPPRSIGDVLERPDALNDVALEGVCVRRSDRLTILPAPATPSRSADIEAETALAVVAAARRLSSFVVLDLPHLWAPWVKQAILGADEIVLVSSPDIASLRNTDNIAKLIKNERSADPVVVLSMTGVPKRPEVPLKEFAEALGIAPACSLPFEPNIFGAAALTGQMLGEIAPRSKTAALLDQLAQSLTGREPIEITAPTPRGIQELAQNSGPAAEPKDPFDAALVNPIALMSAEGVPPELSADAPLSEIAPLELLEPALLEPDYLARARAAALDELDAIENPRHPQRRRFGPLASVAAGFAITALAVSAYLFLQINAAPTPAAAAHVVAAVTPPAPPTPQQMAGDYQIAMQLLEEGAVADAVARLERLATAGFAVAQYRLAKLYERGEGVTPDLVRARQWTERAANAGNRQAIHDLGVYYARGEGAPRDDATAFRLFKQAALLGLADSQFNLGVLYEQGRGVEANPGEALFWFMLASQQDDAAAADRAAALQAALTPFEIAQAEARLAAFRPEPADPTANGMLEPIGAASGSDSVEGAERASVPVANGG